MEYVFGCNETGNFEVSPEVVFVHVCLDQDHNLLIRIIRRSCLVSTENGWKSALLRNVNLMTLNRLRLERLIPIEHDQR